MTVTETRNEAIPIVSAAVPGTATATESATATATATAWESSSWVPATDLLPRTVEAPITGSGRAVVRTAGPWVVALLVYIGIGIAGWGGTGILDWGGRDASSGNVVFGWELYTIPFEVAVQLALFMAVSLAWSLSAFGVGVAWKKLVVDRRRRPTDAPSPPPTPDAPTSFTTKARFRADGRRWTEGRLVLDDGGLSFEPTGKRKGAAVRVPWPLVTGLRLDPRIAWGRCQRGHLLIRVRQGRTIEVMVPRPGYDRLARLLDGRPVDTESSREWLSKGIARLRC